MTLDEINREAFTEVVDTLSSIGSDVVITPFAPQLTSLSCKGAIAVDGIREEVILDAFVIVAVWEYPASQIEYVKQKLVEASQRIATRIANGGDACQNAG